MIPKKIHLYWGGTPLSYLRYLTVATLSRHNPDWEIVIHTGGHSAPAEWTTGEQGDGYYMGDDYLPHCGELHNVTMRLVCDEKYAKMHPVMVSDCLRWEVLKDGGFWSDFDMIYRQSLDMAIRNFKNFNPHVVLYHYSRVEINLFYVFIGTIFSTGDVAAQTACGVLHYNALKNATNTRYQAAGTKTVTELVRGGLYGVDTYRPDVFYPTTGGSEVNWLFMNNGPLDRRENPPVGIHWYGGHPKSRKWEEQVTPKTLDLYRNLYLFRGL